MKIIDLLNKIANGEKVPNFIVDEVEYYMGANGYLRECMGDDVQWYIDKSWLNTEVEILEEKKIPEKWNDLSFTTMRKKEDSIDDDIHKLKGYIETIMRTQNEIIDYLKSKGE